MVINMCAGREILSDSKWIHHRGIRHWQKMEAWQPDCNDRSTYRLTMSEDKTSEQEAI